MIDIVIVALVALLILVALVEICVIIGGILKIRTMSDTWKDEE